MAGQTEFLQALQELERLGESNEGHLSVTMIADYFSDMSLGQEQMDMICRYLQSHQIIIDGWVPGEMPEEILDEEITTVEDPLDHSMVEIYMKETTGTAKLSKEQEEQIAAKLVTGDENARNLLIEANLNFAVEVAKRYKGKGLQMSDLIQESNIGLMIAVNDFEPSLHGNFHNYVEQSICRHIEETIDEYNGSTRSAMKMANRINELNDIATAFAKEYEREAKPSEIARRMGISEEEVRELMKVSLDAIAVIER